MGLLLSCLNFFALLLIILPAFSSTLRWFQNGSKAERMPLGIWGNSLLLLSTFYIPWLNLNPLKYLGLDWLIDVAPPLLAMGLKLLRTERLGFLGKFFDVLGPIFGPPGWATLLLTARWPMMLLMGTVVGVTVVLGYMVAVLPRWKDAGIPLLISSGLAFLILFYNLPTIDGLGERSFPSLFSLAVPLVGAQIEWGGPLIMFAGLCLLFFAGARSSAGITSSE